jgi:hypothetical protein
VSISVIHVGTDRGAIVFADDLGHCTDVQQVGVVSVYMQYN